MTTGINLNEIVEVDGIEFYRSEVLDARGIAHTHTDLFDEAIWFYSDMSDESNMIWDNVEILCQGYNEFADDPDDMDGHLTGMIAAEIQALMVDLDRVESARFAAQESLIQM